MNEGGASEERGLFDRQPVLVGDLVRVRPLADDDFDSLFAVASDPLIWEQHPSKERSERAGFERGFADAMASGGALIVLDLSDGSVIGSSRYRAFDLDQQEVEIGWTFLARSHWGGQANADLKRLMIGHAFDSDAIDTVVFRVHSLNLRSQRAVQKLGAQQAGTEVDPKGRGENHVYRLGQMPPA